MIQYFVFRVLFYSGRVDYSFYPLGPFSTPEIAATVLDNQDEIIGCEYLIGKKVGIACTFIYAN